MSKYTRHISKKLFHKFVPQIEPFEQNKATAPQDFLAVLFCIIQPHYPQNLPLNSSENSLSISLSLSQ